MNTVRSPKIGGINGEILFIYDVTNANPNGDPLDENKPRIDEITGKGAMMARLAELWQTA